MIDSTTDLDDPSAMTVQGPELDRPDYRRSDRLVALLVVGVPFVVAMVLGSIEVSTRSIWIDESASLTIAAQHGGALWTAVARDGGNMFGYYLLLHSLVSWFGNSLLVLRMPSVVGFAAMSALVALLTRRLYGSGAALIAGCLAAISMPGIFWAQDARGYALMLAFVSASYVLFSRLVDPAAKETWGIWLGYIVVTALAIYMTYVAALIIPAELGVYLVLRRPLRRALGAAVSIGALCAPLFILAARRGSGQLFWVPRPTFQVLSQVITSLTSAGYQPNFALTATSVLVMVVTMIAFAYEAYVVLQRAREEHSIANVWKDVLVLSWLVIPCALALIESFVAQPSFSARNLLVALPATAVILARLLTNSLFLTARARTLLCGLVALRVLQIVPSYGTSPENWRAATSYVISHDRSGDCIAFFPLDGRMAFVYYFDQQQRSVALRPVLPRAPFAETIPYLERYATLSAAQLGAVDRDCSRVWLIASHEGFANGPSVSRADYYRYLDLENGLAADYGTPTTNVFGWASPVRVELYATSS